jgi:murein DD-endopeptidase MepM/ murein hydrolase activator NlpD
MLRGVINFTIGLVIVLSLPAQAQAVAFALPVAPEDVKISSFSNPRRTVKIGSYIHKGAHLGIDFSAGGKKNVLVRASAAGEVIEVQTGCPNGARKRCGRGFGNHVRIKHADGIVTTYAHLARKCAESVKVGQMIEAGHALGCIGNSGMSSGPHLCFRATDSDGKPISPEILLGASLARVERKADVTVPKHLGALKNVLTSEGAR